jgi:hypothetical protein
MRKLQHVGTVTHYTSVGVHTLMENYGKAGISTMFINITIIVFLVKGKMEKKNIFALANKTHTFTYKAFLSYYSVINRL